MSPILPKIVKKLLQHQKTAKVVYKLVSYTTVGCFSALYFKEVLKRRTIKDELPLVEKTNVSSQELAKSKKKKLKNDNSLNEVQIKPDLSKPKSNFFSNLPFFDTMNPQKVMELVHSSKLSTRKSVAEKIANYNEWTDSECLTIAQALNSSTQIAISRDMNTDHRLLIAPPPLPKLDDQTEVSDIMRNILMELPVDKNNKCLQYYTSDALNTTEEYHMKNVHEKNRTWDFNQADDAILLGFDSIKFVEKLCLNALLKHSLLEENCEEMVKNGILLVLRRINDKYKDDVEIKQPLLRLIANICSVETTHQSVKQSGWIGVLASHCRSSEIYCSMQAIRALANLDRESEKYKYKDGIFLLSPVKRMQHDADVDVIFLHGLYGSPLVTWRQHDSVKDNRTECWPKDWLSQDVKNCRVLSVEYETSFSDWRSMCPYEQNHRTIEFRSKQMLQKIKMAGLGDKPIIWVSHSLGGLIVKYMLQHASQDTESFGNIAKNTKGTVFYGTPHFGSKIATFSQKAKKVLYPSKEVEELAQDSPKQRQLNEFLKNLFESGKLSSLSFGEALATNIGFGYNLHVVPPDTADPGFGEFVTVPHDHIDISKPTDRQEVLYSKLIAFINTTLNADRDENELLMEDFFDKFNQFNW